MYGWIYRVLFHKEYNYKYIHLTAEMIVSCTNLIQESTPLSCVS